MELVSELLGILNKQQNLLENLSKSGGNPLADKNISKSENSTFSESKKNSSRLSSNEKKKIDEISSIFLKKFDKEKSSSKVQNVKKIVEPKKTLLKETKKVLEPKKIIGFKDDRGLTPSGKSRYLEISKIFVKTFFDEKNKRKSDTRLETSIKKPDESKSSLNLLKGKNLQPKEEEKKGWLSTLLGLLGAAGLLTAFKKRIIKFFKNILKRIIRGIYRGIKSIISSVLKAFKSGISSLWKKIKGSNIFKSLSKGLSNLKKAITSKLNSLWKGFKNLISSVAEKAKNLTKKVAESGTKAASKAAESIKNAVQKTTKSKPTPSKTSKFFSAVKNVTKTAASKVGDVTVKGLKVAGKTAVAGTQLVGKGVKGAVNVTKTVGKKAAMAGLNKAASGVIKGSGGMFKLMGKLAKVPIIGPIIEGLFTASDIKKYKKEYQEGKISEKELQQKSGKRVISGVTAALGSAGGAALGGAVGSVIPVAGNIIGAIVGGVLGDMAGRLIGNVFSEYIIPEKYVKTIGAYVTKTSPPKEEMQDFVIKNNRVYKFSKKDDILGMKAGGAIDKLFSRKENQKNIIIKQSDDSLNRLISINNITNNFLKAIANNTAIMAKTSGGSTKPIVISNNTPAPPSNESSKVFSNVENNRMGYASSPYAL